MDTFDECDAVINHRTRLFNDGITTGKRIRLPECDQGKFFCEHFGFLHKCFEVEPDATVSQEFSTGFSKGADLTPHRFKVRLVQSHQSDLVKAIDRKST